MIIGELKLFAFWECPRGLIECKGQTLSIEKYRNLYIMIGNRFGSEEDTVFYLPDLKGCAPGNLRYFIVFEGEMPEIVFDGNEIS